jgi:hypothetical protein
MKSQARTLQNKSGGWDAILFSHLSEHSNKPAVKRVEKIFNLLVAAQTYSDQLERVEKNPSIEILKYREYKRAYYDCLAQLGDAVKNYRWRITINYNSEEFFGFKADLDPVNANYDYGHWEYALVHLLLEKAQKSGRDFSRFRRCQHSDCQRWFYAETTHQIFCGENCRKRHASQSPEFKEKRRIYMREKYRPQQKELEQRSIANARKAKPKQTKG